MWVIECPKCKSLCTPDLEIIQKAGALECANCHVLSFYTDCRIFSEMKLEDEYTGKKFDKNKPRWDLIPWNQMRKVVHVMAGGAIKYGDNNWQKVPKAKERYFRAAIGHITDWWCDDGNIPDEESKTSHLAHAICCCLILMWFDEGVGDDL